MSKYCVVIAQFYVLLFLLLGKPSFGAHIPIPPDPEQDDPRMLWRGPETPSLTPGPPADTPPLSGDTDFSVLVTNLLTVSGDVRIENLDIMATQIICNQIDKDNGQPCLPIRADEISLPTSVITSVDPPVLRSGSLSDAFLNGIMTLPDEGFWKFETTADFEGAQISIPTIYYVPEPCNLLLAMLGLALLPMYRRWGHR